MSSVFAKARVGRSLLCAVGCALLLSACADDAITPESKLRAAVDEIASSVQTGAAKQVGEKLASGYRDSRNPDKRSAIAMLYWYLRQHKDIHLFTLVRDIEIDESIQVARSVVMVAMAGVPITSRNSLVSLNADFYRFDVTWRYENQQWLVTGSDWQRATFEDF